MRRTWADDIELAELALAMVCAGRDCAWRGANVLGSCRQDAHVSAIMASERRRLLMRQMASTSVSLLNPSSRFSCEQEFPLRKLQAPAWSRPHHAQRLDMSKV